MTRDELRERIADECITMCGAFGEELRYIVADRILALIPPRPKLEWREHDELLEKVSAAIDETLYAYSHGMMSEAMAKESILTIADEWATDDDEILAHMEMLVRTYAVADDDSLTDAAKVLKRRVLVACAPLMKPTVYFAERASPAPVESPWAEDDE